MRDGFGVGFAEELASLFCQPLPQLAKILDDAVVDDRNEICGVRMSIVFGWPAVRCPPRMTNADIAPKRLAIEPRFERAQLAFRTTSAEHAVVKRGNARRVITSVLKALESVDQLLCNRFASQDSDYSAHPSGWPLCPLPYRLAADGRLMEITTHFGV
jgi:hypothetical protein